MLFFLLQCLIMISFRVLFLTGTKTGFASKRMEVNFELEQKNSSIYVAKTKENAVSLANASFWFFSSKTQQKLLFDSVNIKNKQEKLMIIKKRDSKIPRVGTGLRLSSSGQRSFDYDTDDESLRSKKQIPGELYYENELSRSRNSNEENVTSVIGLFLRKNASTVSDINGRDFLKLTIPPAQILSERNTFSVIPLGHNSSTKIIRNVTESDNGNFYSRETKSSSYESAVPTEYSKYLQSETFTTKEPVTEGEKNYKNHNGNISTQNPVNILTTFKSVYPISVDKITFAEDKTSHVSTYETTELFPIKDSENFTNSHKELTDELVSRNINGISQSSVGETTKLLIENDNLYITFDLKYTKNDFDIDEAITSTEVIDLKDKEETSHSSIEEVNKFSSETNSYNTYNYLATNESNINKVTKEVDLENVFSDDPATKVPMPNATTTETTPKDSTLKSFPSAQINMNLSVTESNEIIFKNDKDYRSFHTEKEQTSSKESSSHENSPGPYDMSFNQRTTGIIEDLESTTIRKEIKTAAITKSILQTKKENLSLSEVKIVPVQQREYTLFVVGIILCCFGVLIIIAGVTIFYFYNCKKKRESSDGIEMRSSITFEDV